MAIKTSGPLSIQDVVNEFGGSAPHSLNEYYRGGGRVPDAPINNSVPTSGAISLENFYGATNAFVVSYEIVGAGGGGGNGSDNREPNLGTFAPSGGISSIKSPAEVIVQAAGGRGGANDAGGRANSGGNGEGTVYGPGGTGGPRNTAGSPAPTSSYGAGGGGGGGDKGALFDRSGAAGLGGLAGERKTGSALVVPGTQLTITIGRGGAGGSGNYPGGRGANGYCKLTVNGVDTVFTATSTFIV